MFLRCFADTHQEPYDDTYKIEPKPNDSIHLVLDYNKKLDYGTCVILVNEKISKEILFCTENTKQSCIKQLKSKFTVLSRKEFVEKIFFPYVHKARAKCIGFGLPFIISRLATDVTESRRHPNGFSFTLSERAKHPHIVIKSIDSQSQFIELNKTFRKKTKDKIPYYRGCFVDCKTLGFVLTNNSYDVQSALDDFDVAVPTDESSINDVLTIYSLYKKQMARWKLFCLDKLENKLFSPASIGKSYLEKIGITPFLKQNPEFPKEILGFVSSAYYGARVEARRVNNPTNTTVLDFTSMYPTLFVLFGMYRLLIAEKIDHKDTTHETQEFLDKVTISDINQPETWKNMLTLCKIVPEGEVLPVRSDYTQKSLNTGINYLTSEDGTSLRFTLPDLIASKLLTGKTPQILEAITFYPQGVQSGLKDIEILDGVTLKKGDDLFCKLIECRFELQKNTDKTSKQLQKILKIIANSTCYGKFIQLNTRKTILKKDVTVYGLDSFDVQTRRLENSDKFYHPIISVFLTAGSRLILAAAEHLLEQNNGYLMYCDTDSVFVTPEHSKMIQEFFQPLNPYSKDVEMFKVQKEDGKKLEDVICLAISSKRYVVYNKYDDDITIFKYSNHALGHYVGIDHKQFWYDIISLWYNPEKEDEIVSKYDTKHAISELPITNYSFWNSFDGANQGKTYSQKTRPYDMILVGTACRTDSDCRPIVPFVPKNGSNWDQIPFMPFVDKSGISYPNSDSLDTVEYWKKMSKVFSEYRGHRESKLNCIDGVAKRKHLVFGKESVKYVGKEVHDLESSKVFGVSDSITYENEQEKLYRIIEELTLEKAEFVGISRRTYFDWKKKVRERKSIVLKNKLKIILFSKYFETDLII